MADLTKGLYEQLISQALHEALALLDTHGLAAVCEALDPADSHELLTRHVAGVLQRVLRGLPEKNRLEEQVRICNEILQVLRSRHVEAAPAGETVHSPAEALFAVLQARATPGGDSEVLPRPHVPLSASDLLVNARGEPAVGHALDREIPSADRIDLLCAFVRWNGLRLLLPRLRTHCAQGRLLRVITTTYTGTTERRAIDELVAMGAQVRVSYETRSTRLHAKAWLFHRETGFSTAYIGSSNLTQWALVDGLEWNVRLSQVTSPDILEKFQATFDSYWEEPDFEPYDPARDAQRFDLAVSAPSATDPLQLSAIDVIPFPHQREILERLAVERERHHRFRTLVVAATGTGKTIVAALDYRRLRDEFGDLRLLFVAHRKELLGQSLSAFRQVLREGSFGELYVDGYRPRDWRHVFASVQSLAQLDLADLKPEAFDVVIVDEFHHAAAPTYERLLDNLRPKYLVGLTATPERADGESVLGWFDGRIAIELRLWEALERGLLCPFHYFGVHDNTDLSGVTWSRRGYDVRELENLYTANHARVGLIARALAEKVADLRRMRALGFCVSIAHAEFMAREFNRIGLPSLAVSSESGRDERDDALRRFRLREVNVVFAVDLFNEGIDVPEIDTVLFLRPTESATVFLQQLGRGLRQHDHKACLTVLDFIGSANRRFRFDQRYRALTETTRAGVIMQIEEGFPFLPAGCTIQLDRVSTDLVLENLRESIGASVKTFVRELQQIGRDVGLAGFLREAGVSLDELYRNPGWTWTRIRREARLPTLPPGPREEQLSRALGRLLHQDDPVRLAFLQEFLSQSQPRPAASLTESQRRILLALHFTLWGTQDDWSSIDDSVAALWQHPAIISELRELLSVLEDEATHLTHPLGADAPWTDVPLSVHGSYSLDEILAAFGEMTLAEPHRIREGTKFNPQTNSDLFFVTLEKSEERYSPTTMYKDYAISPVLFHWESQSVTTQASRTGQRYIHHRQQGSHILLFVRRRARAGTRTAPYVFLGPADYVSHKGERPIAFTWRLRRAMPADFFREAKVAAG
jgi:superfamily II DNA or RNA helicase/HKD family nuclease